MKKKLTISLLILAIILFGTFVFFSGKTLSLAQQYLVPSKQIINNQAASSTSALKPSNQSVSFIFTGDIMLSRNVAQKIKASKNVNFPFLKVGSYLKSADLVFANLENPVTAGPSVPVGSMVFHADPGVEQALKNNNISVVSLANNHTPNYGQKGLSDTFKYLQAAGIKFAGAGKTDLEANQPVFLTSKGLKFALLAYNDSDVVPASYGAGPKRAGTNLMDVKKMTDAVKAAKRRADFVIVSMHSGKEYTENLTASQTSFAHAAIDAGAELVVGHHPHVVQRVEKYKGKYIFYSLGNFIFDQMWSQDTRRGMTAKVLFTPAGVTKIEMTPVLIENYSQPKLLTGKEAEKTLKRLRVVDDKNIILKK